MPIEKAKQKDIETIHHLINKSNRDAYSEIVPDEIYKDPILTMEEVRELFEEMDFYIYRKEKKIVGVAALNVDSEKIGKIRWVHVHPDYRKCGIGTNLIKKIEKEAKKMDLEKLLVKYVLKKADWAKKFYSDMGYEKIREVSHSQGECFIYEKEI